MKVRNPITKRMILVNGQTYKKVFKDSYIIIPEDIIREILYHSDVDTIKNYHLCRKNIKMDNYFWQYIYSRDNIKICISNNLLHQYLQKSKCIKEASQILALFDIENEPTMYISIPSHTKPYTPTFTQLPMNGRLICIFNNLLDNITYNDTFTIEILIELLYVNPNLLINTNRAANLRLKHLIGPYVKKTDAVIKRIKFYDNPK
jgi:hypothetical protein